MSNLDTRNIEAMILKLGDDDEVFLSSKFRRTIEQIRACHGSPELPNLFAKIQNLIAMVPGKSNIYATLLSVLESNFGEQIEGVMHGLVTAFKTSIDQENENQAVNIVMFLSEAVRVGLMNSLTFISVLIDLGTMAEENPAKLKFLAKLILLPLPGVLDIFREKYDMEVKNMLEDFGKQLAKKMKTDDDFSDEWAAFEIIRSMQAGTKYDPIFTHLRLNLGDENQNVRNVRKNFKLPRGHNPQTPAATANLSPKSRKIFRSKIVDINGGKSPLNILAISTHLRILISVFRKKPDLLLERINSTNWGPFSELKDWLFFEILVDMICQDSLEGYRKDRIFVCKTLASSIELHKTTHFYEKALEQLSENLAQNANPTKLVWISRIIKMVLFVNFQAKTALSISTENFATDENLFYFINMFFAIQIRLMSLKSGTNDDSHGQRSIKQYRTWGLRKHHLRVFRILFDLRGRA